MTRRFFLRSVFLWLSSKRPDFNALRRLTFIASCNDIFTCLFFTFQCFHLLQTYAFWLSVWRTVSSHTASSDGLSGHTWVKLSWILPITSVLHDDIWFFSAGPFQQISCPTSPRLQSSRSPQSGISWGSSCFLFSPPFPLHPVGVHRMDIFCLWLWSLESEWLLLLLQQAQHADSLQNNEKVVETWKYEIFDVEQTFKLGSECSH